MLGFPHYSCNSTPCRVLGFFLLIFVGSLRVKVAWHEPWPLPCFVGRGSFVPGLSMRYSNSWRVSWNVNARMKLTKAKPNVTCCIFSYFLASMPFLCVCPLFFLDNHAYGASSRYLNWFVLFPLQSGFLPSRLAMVERVPAKKPNGICHRCVESILGVYVLNIFKLCVVQMKQSTVSPYGIYQTCVKVNSSAMERWRSKWMI